MSESLTEKVRRTTSPVNSIAARVIGVGIHYDLDFKTEVFSYNPLPVRKFPSSNGVENDLTGKVFGRLTVIGLADIKGQGKNGAAWVTRCICSMYQHRRTKALKHLGERSMCSKCDRLEQRKQGFGPWSAKSKERKATNAPEA